MSIRFTTNAASFRAAMETRAANLKIGNQRRIVLFALTMHRELVLNTPILTGKAKAEWQMGLDTDPTTQVLGRVRPPNEVDYETYNKSAEDVVSGFQSGQTIYIVNNAPYIDALNAGSSIQAPAGFVEAAQATALAVLKATVKGS